MSGSHRMPPGESSRALRDLRRDDAARALEATREHGIPESCKTRILGLRATIEEIRRLAEELGPGKGPSIRQRILDIATEELATPEVDLLL